MELGKYLTSFLRIYINTNLQLDNMKGNNLTDYEKRIFVHEYTHFLQNISGAFGHLHAWNIYDRMRQHIAEIQKNHSDQITIPLAEGIADEQRNYLRIIKRMQGSYKVKEGMDDATTKIVSLRFTIDEELTALYQDKNPVYYLVLDLVDEQGTTMEYIFGEAAVSEAMALLMESKYFETDPANNFPYHVCRLIARHIKADFIEDDALLFALCDVSLLSSFPGTMFYRILHDIQVKELLPLNAEQLFEAGINFMYGIGWQIFKDYKKNMEGTCHVIRTLLSNTVFKATVDWVTYLFQMGYNCRIENRYFLLQLYQEPIVFEGSWNNIIAQFGNPEIHNNSPLRAFIAPLALQANENEIQPILMLALHEVHETFFRGKCECSLVKYCEQSTNGLIVDKRCVTAPWERAKDESLCASGALWAGFGINDKKVVLAKV